MSTDNDAMARDREEIEDIIWSHDYAAGEHVEHFDAERLAHKLIAAGFRRAPSAPAKDEAITVQRDDLVRVMRLVPWDAAYTDGFMEAVERIRAALSQQQQPAGEGE